tara:strand:- start:784 stop:1344 length:561 start_codon:yes stop_codon:yes gene_type:complete
VSREIKKSKLDNNFDKLFFNFLIIIGYPGLDINYNNNIEKNIKYIFAQNLEKIKFKKINNVIENLCYEENINLYTLSALCKYNNLNFIYINENIKYEMFYNEDSNSYYLVNNNKDIKFVKKENLYKICENKYNIQNIEKPINSITYYKLDELSEIYNKINNDYGHTKYKKKEMYEIIKKTIYSLIL